VRSKKRKGVETTGGNRIEGGFVEKKERIKYKKKTLGKRKQAQSKPRSN
jgi:hypothetical protein